MGTGPTNPYLQMLIKELRTLASTKKAGVWAAVADNLEKPTRSRREVNLSRISRNTSDKEVIVVPGKVLGSGMISHGVTVAAWSFSESAKKRIVDAKGKCLSITELVKQFPEGKNVRIIG